MTAGRYNITIEQGATYALPLTVSDVISGSSVLRDLTGYSARMKIKEFIDDSTEILSLTTANSSIVIDPDQVTNKGELSINISAATTSSLVTERCVYDLELVNGVVVERLLQGKVTLKKEVTD